MKRKVCIIYLITLLLVGSNAMAQLRSDESLSFNLTDKRDMITHDINGNILLRVIKDKSGLGWDVQVVKKPINLNSLNLLYHSLDWHGPYPSQIYAWHVAKKYFPNERYLQIRGYPYDVIISLTNASVDGYGNNLRFVSGSVTISWKRRP
jgi:hypothetical protein